MFFVLSKLLGVFTFPSNLTILIGILGLFLLPTRLARAGRWLVVVSLILLVILGFSPVGNMLIIPLETRFPQWDAARGTPDGIIVLGGVIDASSPGNQITLNESAEACCRARPGTALSQCPHLVFGWQRPALMGDGSAEAGAAARLFESFGISRDRVILEDRARNTVENAVFSKAIAGLSAVSAGC